MPPSREVEQTMLCQNNVILAVEMSNYNMQTSSILLPLSHWTQSVTQKVKIQCLKNEVMLFQRKLSLASKFLKFVVFGPFSPK